MLLAYNMQQLPQLTSITSLELRKHLGHITNLIVIEGKHLQLTKSGVPVMIMLPIQDYKLLKTSYAQQQK